MKIAISGTHSTGKSTALRAVGSHLERSGYKVLMVSDLAIKCPLPILRNHTAASSLWIASSGVSQEIECEADADIVLVDRPIIDAWGYLMAATIKPSHDSRALLTLEALIQRWMPSYDFVFSTQLDPSIKIENAKNRDLDEVYRADVAHNIIESYARFGVEPRILTSDSIPRFSDMIDDLFVNV